MWSELLALIVLLLVEVAAIVAVVGGRRRYAALESAIDRAQTRTQEQALRIDALDELREDRDLASQFVGSSSSIARSVQRSFSEIPTPLLDNLPGTAKVARELHHNVSRDVADAVAALSKAFRTRSRGRRDAVDKSRDSDDQRPAS